MIEHVKFGKHKQENFYTHYKDIKTQYILWLSIFHTGKSINLFRDKVATGSFDKTAKLWDTETGNLLYTFAGHQS
jgi:WD40 repeat protein